MGLKKYQFEDGKNPIYNLNLLKENPGKPILIVEGEKSADAEIQMPDHLNNNFMAKKCTRIHYRYSEILGRNDQLVFNESKKISGCVMRRNGEARIACDA